jgi:microsomal dipeptidase-like Zn-dependent dipeptidase
LVLATGHSSAEEALMLVHEGRRQGVQHMVVTHAMSRFPHMTIPQMQEAAKEGAFIELVYVHTLTIPELGRTANFTLPDAAEAIRRIGASSVILSTDMGQVGIALPVDGLSRFAAGLRAEGLTGRDLDSMMKDNPARLLGLPVTAR